MSELITKLNPDLVIPAMQAPSIIYESDYMEQLNNIPYKSHTYDPNTKIGVIILNDSEIPSVSYGDSGAFYGSKFTKVTIDGNVTSIGTFAFYRCINLKSVTIGNKVTSIESNTFCDCTSLTSVIIGNGVTLIGPFAFNHCSSLTSITIPDSVTLIGDYAFDGCTSLTSVTIPNRVTSIGYGAFNKCTSLTSVTIPDSVTSIGDSAFGNCATLHRVIVKSSIPPTMSSTLPDTVECVYVPSNALEDYENATNWSNQNLIGSDVLNNSGDDMLLTLLTLEKRINELENNLINK